jgi:hypothetical protein
MILIRQGENRIITKKNFWVAIRNIYENENFLAQFEYFRKLEFLEYLRKSEFFRELKCLEKSEWFARFGMVGKI